MPSHPNGDAGTALSLSHTRRAEDAEHDDNKKVGDTDDRFSCSAPARLGCADIDGIAVQIDVKPDLDTTIARTLARSINIAIGQLIL